MGKLEKLIEKILKLDKNLRFNELAKVLIRLGYKQNQPKGGSRHYIFRKDSFPPISIPKDNPIKIAYVELVRDAVAMYLTGGEQK
jgi:hypothetical protein